MICDDKSPHRHWAYLITKYHDRSFMWVNYYFTERYCLWGLGNTYFWCGLASCDSRTGSLPVTAVGFHHSFCHYCRLFALSLYLSVDKKEETGSSRFRLLNETWGTCKLCGRDSSHAQTWHSAIGISGRFRKSAAWCGQHMKQAARAIEYATIRKSSKWFNSLHF